jgi:hypothetical protein
MRWVLVAALVVACAKEVGVGEAAGNAGADASSCPDHEPNDAGVMQLTRACALAIDCAIR